MIRDAERVAWAGEVGRALDSLGQDEQVLLRLSYVGGLTQAGIAESTGVALGLVARMIATGMQQLGHRIEADLRIGPSTSTGGALPVGPPGSGRPAPRFDLEL